jgi:hypothetical protein
MPGPRKPLLWFAALLLAPCTAQAQPVTGFDRINQPGFGDRQNSYAWSMAWFDGKLYVGTCRNFDCVTLATLDRNDPTKHTYSAQPDPCVDCTPDPNDLDLRAEIWCYDPGNGQWSRVYQSPADVPNPNAPGKFVARDIGYRNMIVYSEADGSQALYVAGCSARDHLGASIPPPRLLRTTDGTTFDEVPLSLPDIPGQTIAGFRAMAQFRGKLYMTATYGLRGEGALLESDNPGGGGFRLVSDPKMLIYDIAVYNNQLYYGVGDFTWGYSVWRTSATGNPPYAVAPVMGLGGGRGPLVVTAVAMHVFNNRLYVSANGWGALIFPQFTELIRINPDNSWDLVVGNRRFYLPELRQKYPISGMPDGFGNPFNAHIWRIDDHSGVLYAGTNDTSWTYRRFLTFIGGWSDKFGFDLFASRDGQFWAPYTINGFGKGSDFGVRTFASTPDGMFLGSADDCYGLEVFQGRDSAGGNASSARLMSEAVGRGNALSWEAVPDAAKYNIYRSTPQSVKIPAPPGSDAPMMTMTRPGPFTLVGTSAEPVYRDRTAKTGQTYLYYMRAVDRKGRLSGPSNFAVASSHARPGVTVGDLDRQAGKLEAPEDDDDRQAGLAALRERVGSARAAIESGDLDEAARTLRELRDRASANADKALDPVAAEDLADVATRLLRRVELARKGILSRDDLTGPAKP